MKHLAILAALIGPFLFCAHYYTSPAPFSYDEADYMYAAGRGFQANYLDRPSLSFAEYVRAGLSQGRDPGQKSALSKSVRSSGDVFFYRHAHGPMYFYWLMALSAWNTNESFIRGFSPVFAVVTAMLIYFGCLWLLPPPQGTLAGVIATVAYLSSPAVFRSTEVAPHAMFVLWFIVSLLLVAKLLQTGQRKYWYAAVATTAVSFCTLEVTFVLIFTVMVCGYLERSRLGMDLALMAKSIALFAGLTVLLHPATLTKLAFAKSYLYFAYLSLHRQAVWGQVTFLETWTTRFINSPVEWMLIAAAVFLYIRFRNLPGRRQAVPFLLFGAVMLATMLRVFTTGARYMLPFVPALHVFAGLVVAGFLMRWKPRARFLATVAICCGLALDVAWYATQHPFYLDPHASVLLAEIRQRNLDSSRLLVPHDDLPTLHYYFPRAQLTSYADPNALPAGEFDAIVRMTDPVIVDRLIR